MQDHYKSKEFGELEKNTSRDNFDKWGFRFGKLLLFYLVSSFALGLKSSMVDVLVNVATVVHCIREHSEPPDLAEG